MPPPTNYARNESAHIAYQLSGDGPLDILFIPETAGHLEVMWEEPRMAVVLQRLQGFGRLIMFDKRGTGLSDPVAVAEASLLENWVADAVAVLDAIGSRRVAVVAAGGGGPIGVLLAAMHPERVAALVLLSAWVRLPRSDDFPVGLADDLVEAQSQYYEAAWGTGDMLRYLAPDLARDEKVLRWYAKYERNMASPGVALAFVRMGIEADLREVLSAVRVPTLVMHREGDHVIPVSHARHIAENITGAKLCILPGEAHVVFDRDADDWLDETEEFLTGRRDAERTNRVLTTVLFTDIVGSTEMAERLRDDKWKDLLDRHDAAVRRAIARFGGTERDTAGDEFFATFAGPAHAIRCAVAINEAVRELGLTLRSGVHTGEVEVRADGLGGIALHIAHRVMEQAEPSEVLVSRTVVDLTAGSDLEFEPRGEHELKGVRGMWSLYAVSA